MSSILLLAHVTTAVVDEYVDIRWFDAILPFGSLYRPLYLSLGAFALDLTAAHAWVMGNEAWGLPEALREACDEVVRVPIHGMAESLNLAMAATVCLYTSATALARA